MYVMMVCGLPENNPFKKYFSVTGLWLIYSVVFHVYITVTQSYMYMCSSFLRCISRFSQSTEQGSLCCTAGPSWLSVLHIVACVCVCIPSSRFILPSPHFPSGDRQFVFDIHQFCFCFINKFICIFLNQIPHTSDIIQYLSLSV